MADPLSASSAEDPWANHVRAATPPPRPRSTSTAVADDEDPLSLNVQSTPKASRTIPSSHGQSLEEGSDAGERQEEPAVETAINGFASASLEEQAASPLSETQPQADAAHSSDAEPASQADEEVDDDDEEFVYPGTADDDDDDQAQPAAQEPPSAADEVALEPTPAEPEASPISDSGNEETPPVARLDVPPIDFSRLSQLCTHGPLVSLSSFFDAAIESGVSSFALANEPHPSSGLVPLHYAAREGQTDIAKWLVEDKGALVEMEDREGETALHKAALAGRLPVLTYLLAAGASADARDADGWTALHNACSRGYLDIVRVLIENAGASVEAKGGRGAWTPLMNAASKGHVPIVRYLTSRYHADPFARNAAGETAYDVAAGAFEVFTCELLEKYEAERWAALKLNAPAPTPSVTSSAPARPRIAPGQGAYNPLALHTTVPVILHENQRLDTRLSTLAIHGGRPRWSGTSAGRLTKPDRRAPGTMPPGPLASSRTRNMPMRREDIKLPTRAQPYKLRLPARGGQPLRRDGRAVEDMSSTPTPRSVLSAESATDGVEGGAVTGDGEHAPSHFWLSEWQTDLTHPQVDAEEGWQYAQSFDAPEDRWTAVVPPPLARLLEGKGLGASVGRAMTGGVLPAPGQTAISTGSSATSDVEAVATGWVRRRRWIRVMRRRLDIEFGDELEGAEVANASAAVSGESGLHATLSSAAVVAAENEARQECAALGNDADYLARAQALAGPGAGTGATPADALGEGVEELRKRIARLDLAVGELRGGAFSDEDTERRGRAEDLLKEYTLQLRQLRQAAGLEDGGDADEEDEDEDDDEAFIYPNSYKDDGQSVITRIGGGLAGQSSTTTGFAPAPAPSEAGTSFNAARSADLAAASEFRVPTRERPNRPATFGRNNSSGLREHNLVPQWENDRDVGQCRDCQRKFTFFLRKHHCRRCGRIFCADCSTHRVHLSASELVIDPGVPEMLLHESLAPTRVCNACFADRSLPQPPGGIFVRTGLGGGVGREEEPNGRGMERSDSDAALSDVSSRASELNECPVCNTTLAGLGSAAEQEAHVRDCLERGGGGSVQSGRYLVYRLGESPIVGRECIVCFETFEIGATIARLPCLCYYHKACLDSWFSRGRSCPVHAREL